MALTFPSKSQTTLRSWKEIASYLGVTVRTVQRWEKDRGLPIHRQGFERKARVLAYSQELDQWSSDMQAMAVQEEGNDRSGRLWLWIPSVLFFLAIGAGGLDYMWLTGPPARAVLEGDRLRVFDQDHRLCWEKKFPGLIRTAYAPNSDITLVQDIDGDAAPEVLFNWAPPESGDVSGELYCYGMDGALRWNYRFGRARQYRGRYFNSKYTGQSVRFVHSGRRSYVLCSAIHHLWYPCQVSLLDPDTGSLLEEYWHPGGLRLCLVDDVDQDGADEVVLGGINNPGMGLGHAALVVLKVPFSDERRKMTVETDPTFLEFTGGREHQYVLFPRSDLCSVNGDIPMMTNLNMPREGMIVARVPAGETSIFYTFDTSFRVLDVRFTDNYESVHGRWTKMGLLNHDLTEEEKDTLKRVAYYPAAPDGNSEGASRFWKPPIE